VYNAVGVTREWGLSLVPRGAAAPLTLGFEVVPLRGTSSLLASFSASSVRSCSICEEFRLAERDAYTPPSALRLPPSSVLLLTAEDDLADTIRPRLEALGADCDKILAISNIPGENAGDVPRAFALSRDLARLKNLLAAIPDCRLLIIDPISAYLGGTNERANADVQALLTALATLARERNLAVLVVSHLRKKEGAAIYRTMGSLAFVAAARAVWTICKDPDDPNKRLLLPVKTNLAQAACGLAFTIETTDDDVPAVHWSSEPVTATPEQVVQAKARPRGRPDEEREFAIAWLRERLTNGALPVRDVNEESVAQGIAPRTLRRAFQTLGGQAVRQGPFPYGQWMWKLPGVDGQNPNAQYWPPTTFPDDFSHPSNPPSAPTPPFSGGACSAPPPPTNPRDKNKEALSPIKTILDELIANLSEPDPTPLPPTTSPPPTRKELWEASPTPIS
jgi:putative DNA primase/helicase